MERIKKNKTSIIISSVLILVPVLIGIILWDRLPDMIPTHFNLKGEADQYSLKIFTVFFMPLILLALHGIMIIGTASDPKGERVSDKIFNLILYIIPLVSIFVSTMIYLKAMNYDINITRIVLWFISVVFIITGNYIPKARQNYTIGFRTPWTLNDQENWDKTNRFGGYLMVAAGILTFICSFLPNTFIFVLPLLILSGILPLIYSFMLYSRKVRQ